MQTSSYQYSRLMPRPTQNDSELRNGQPAPHKQCKWSTRATQVLEGYLDGNAVQTKPDTGAQANLMSLSFAKSLGLALNRQGPDARVGFPMANGKSLWSIAQASARWRFKDEVYDSYELEFFVIAHCVYNVIVGDDFLQSTQTMIELGPTTPISIGTFAISIFWAVRAWG